MAALMVSCDKKPKMSKQCTDVFAFTSSLKLSYAIEVCILPYRGSVYTTFNHFSYPNDDIRQIIHKTTLKNLTFSWSEEKVVIWVSSRGIIHFMGCDIVVAIEEMHYTPVPYINCTNLTDSEFRKLPLARGVTAAVCLLLCIITLVFVVITKTYKTTLQRIFLYLTLSTVAYLAAITAHIEHYFNFKSPHVRLCKAIGFFDEYTGSVQLLYTLEITLLLFYKVFNKLCHIREKLQWDVLETPQFRFCVQAVLFLVPWMVPPLIDIIPFFITPYGETGPWCWIRTLNRDCTENKAGLWEQLGLWYIPFGLVGVCSLGFIVFMAVVFSVWMCKFEIQGVRGLKKILAETLLLMCFLIAYCILCAIELTGRIIATNNIFGVWMMYAMATPLSAIIIPIAFLVYLFGNGVVKKYFQRCHQHGNREHSELSEAASGAPPSARVPVPSHTDASNLLGTDEFQPLLQGHRQEIINQPEVESESKSQSPSDCVIM